MMALKVLLMALLVAAGFSWVHLTGDWMAAWLLTCSLAAMVLVYF